MATAEGSTLLAFPGLQPGQAQLVRLPPLDSTSAAPSPPLAHNSAAAPFPSITIILAHTTHLSALSTNSVGSILATTSTKGTLVRIWEVERGFRCVRELRRGLDEARIFGVACSLDGGRVSVTSDKGTVHIWDLGSGDGHRREESSEYVSSRARARIMLTRCTESSKKTQLKLLQPYLPKYFSSEWSHSQFRLPAPAPTASRLPFSLSTASTLSGERSSTPTVEDDVCISTWIEVEIPLANPPEREAVKGKMREQPREVERPTRKESQVIALTRSGGWYRIAPQSENVMVGGRGEAGKTASFGLEKDTATDGVLLEHRKFGAKDGW